MFLAFASFNISFDKSIPTKVFAKSTRASPAKPVPQPKSKISDREFADEISDLSKLAILVGVM